MKKGWKKSLLSLVLIIAMVFSLGAIPTPTTAEAVTGLPRNVVIGYWESWYGYSSSTRLRTVSTDWDVINFSFGITDSTQTVCMLSDTPNGLKEDIKFCQDRGQKVVLSVGGESGRVTLKTEAQRDSYYNSLVSIFDEYGFDGIDIDYEATQEGMTIRDISPSVTFEEGTQSTQNIIYILHKLKEKYGADFMVTMAPEHPYVQGGSIGWGDWSGCRGGYLTLIDQCRDIITFIHPQYYNNTIDYPAIGASGYSADSLYKMSKMLIDGFQTKAPGNPRFEGLRPDQVAFGVPATSKSAGSGFVSIDGYAQALERLIADYPTFRGAMTWSINPQQGSGNPFAVAMREVIGDPFFPATVSSVSASVSPTSIEIGKTAQASASVTMSDGSAYSGTIQYSITSGNSFATISSTGLVEGKAEGPVTICAKADGIEGFVTLQVTAPAVSSSTPSSDLPSSTPSSIAPPSSTPSSIAPSSSTPSSVAPPSSTPSSVAPPSSTPSSNAVSSVPSDTVISDLPGVSSENTTEPKLLVMRLNATQALLDGVKVAVDSTNEAVFPFTYDKRTVVPVRFIENLDADVKYNGATKPVTIKYNGITLTLKFGEEDLKIEKDGVVTYDKFETVPKLIEGKTCVPFRAIAEALGFFVKYDQGTFGIVVSEKELTTEEIAKALEPLIGLPSPVKGVKSISAIESTRSLTVGKSVSIKASDITFNPSDAAVKILLYATDNPDVATVTSQGKVKAVGKGIAKITVYSHNGKETVITVTVS